VLVLKCSQSLVLPASLPGLHVALRHGASLGQGRARRSVPAQALF
jgi:hypothetical protein